MYVDKTAVIYDLVTTGKYYGFCRPRGFGKSLLLSKIYHTLESFYCVLKSGDQYIEIGFLTGETDFVNTGWGSGFNNLNYVSTHYRYEDMCGITEAEIDTYFGEEVKMLSNALSLTVGETKLKLKEQYGGYHFSEKSNELYNTLSLLNALENKRFSNYWAEKGAPEILVKSLKESKYFDLGKLNEASLSSSHLNRPTAAPFDYPIPTMYATGYLTIRECDNEFWIYRLCIPNKEVEAGLKELLS